MVQGWKTVYWTPLTMGKGIPKVGIWISVSVKEQRNKIKLEETQIRVEFEEETFRVKL